MYFGGKNGSGTYQQIINKITPHSVYVEPFVGSGAIYRHKLASSISVLCDRLSVPDSSIKNSIRPGDVYISCDTVKSISLIVQLFNFIHLNFAPVFMYCDPPYPLSSRKDSRARYQFELDEPGHIALLVGLGSAKFNVAISTYPNPLYSDYLIGWNLLKYRSITRSGTALEYLYMNYPEPKVLHDYRFIGDDFRERERIGRAHSNMVSKLSKLPPLELASLFHSLTAAGINFKF